MACIGIFRCLGLPFSVYDRITMNNNLLLKAKFYLFNQIIWYVSKLTI